MTRPDRKSQIMQAVEKLVASRRWHEVTTDDIAQEAGVGKGTIYRYFTDKDDLFFQVATSGFDELCDLLRKKVRSEQTFEDQLLCACGAISDYFHRRHNLIRMMQAQDNQIIWRNGRFRQQWQEARKRLVEAMSAIVQRGVDGGRVRSDINTEVLVSLLLGMMRTRARELQDMPATMRTVELVVELFCYGAAAKTAVVKDAEVSVHA